MRTTSAAGGRQEATGGEKHAFYQPLPEHKKGCCTVPCRDEQLLTSITMSTAWRRDGDNSVLPSPTCSAQLSPRLLPCSVAFCLPCNHYNTSFPLASQCLDTHGETQPGTTHSIRGCPLQRKGGGFHQSLCRSPGLHIFRETQLRKGHDALLQTLFKSCDLLMLQEEPL